MNTSLSKPRKALMVIALFLSTMCTMSDMVIVPITANLFEVFEDPMLGNALISIPSIAGIVFCYVGGRLTDRFNKKYLLVGGFTLFAIASLFGAAIVDFYYIFAMRLLTYLAWGFTSTSAMAIIAERFVDESARGKIVGGYNSVMAALGSVLSFVAGLLAVSGWQMAYNTYLIAIPILLMLILFIPNDSPKVAGSSAEAHSKKREAPKGWANKLIPLCVVFFFTAISYYVIAYMISLYVADAGIGSEALSGSLASIGTISSCIMCAAFGFIFAKLKNKTSLPSYLILAIGFLLLFFFPDARVAMFACAIMGGAWGVVFSYYYTQCTLVVPESKQGTSIGIINVVNSFCMLVMTYFLSFLQTATGAETAGETFIYYAGIVLLVFIASVIYKIREKKASASDEKEGKK